MSLSRSPLTEISVIKIPLPTHRLASAALQALSVDPELSPLVRRNFSLVSLDSLLLVSGDFGDSERAGNLKDTVLCTEYRATTNRMLRVAVNGFMESLGVVLQVMEELDVDMLE